MSRQAKVAENTVYNLLPGAHIADLRSGKCSGKPEELLLKDILIRFLIGGVVVSAFAAFGDMFKPKSFAGLFGGAPSVALATLALTIASLGKVYAAAEARSMIAGAAAFFVYACCVSHIMMRSRHRALVIAIAVIPIWFATAFALGAMGL